MQNQKIEGAKEAMLDTNVPPVGAAPGGVWRTEQYSGMVTMIIFIVLLFVGALFCWTPFCCPCDSRQVYVAPNGQKYTRSGAMVPASECCGNPCGGPAE